MLHSIIQSQRFELIRDAIGRVLTAEFANQELLINAYNDEHYSDDGFTCLEVVKPDIWLERSAPFDKEELPAINIFYSDTDFVEETSAFSSRGDDKYIIEIYTNAPSMMNNPGDKQSALLLAKIAGMVRSILMDSKNRHLDFLDYPIVSRNIKSIARTNPRIANDAENTISGIVEAHYFCEEVTETELGTLETTLSTTVKLSDTDKGYKFELINT